MTGPDRLTELKSRINNLSANSDNNSPFFSADHALIMLTEQGVLGEFH